MESTFTLSVEIDTGNAINDLKDFQAGLKDVQNELKKTGEESKKLNKTFSDSLSGMNDKVNELSDNLKGLASGSVKDVTSSVVGLTTGLTGAAAVMVGVAAAAAAVGAALILNAQQMADAADAADEMADKLGVTREELATLQLIAEENAGSVEGLQSVYDKLSKSLAKVEDDNLKVTNAFRALGIAESELAGKTEKEIAGVVIRNWEELGRTAQGTAAVMQLLGGSFRDQIPSIKAAANAFDDYKERIQGTVASDALVEQGARQETALNDLALAWKTFKTGLAGDFSDIITDAAKWSTELIKAVNEIRKNLSVPLVSFSEQMDIAREEEAKLSAFMDPRERTRIITQNADARVKALSKERQEILKSTQAAEQLTRAFDEAKGARDDYTPLTPKEPLKKVEQAKLTEAQKAIIDVSNTERNAIAELDRQIAASQASTDAVTQSTIKLTYELYKAGKGYLDLGTATKIAEQYQSKFTQSIIAANNVKYTETIDNLNKDYETQAKLLKATTEEQREQIRLREQLSKIFEKQPGGATAQQIQAMEDSLRKFNQQFRVLQSLKIDKAVTENLRDLGEQLDSLRFQNEMFWSSNRDHIVNTKEMADNIFRSIDPEGRGKNITDAQKEMIKNQVEAIQRQKELLEMNRQIEQSFSDIGSAVADWAIGSEGAIRRVKIELIKLVALEAIKRYSSDNSIVGTFLKGFVSGLSGRANGGPMMAGTPYLVGEKGPEVVVPKNNSYVIPNNTVSTMTGRPTSVVFAPSLTIQGSVTGQSELDRAFDEFAVTMADQTQQFIIQQTGSRGILRAR